MKAPREKHKNIITMKLKDTWPEITENQKLGQGHHKDNRHKENLKSRFRQRKLYLHRKRITS